MESINMWLVDLNKNHQVWFGITTVITMTGMGVLIAVVVEIGFKLMGVKGKRIEIHH
jgi:hypothetical protein